VTAVPRPAQRPCDPAPDDLRLSSLEDRVADLVAELLVRAYRRRHTLEEEGADPLPKDGAA
jgi:hypothetical protein